MKFGGRRRTLRGLMRLGAEALAPQDFPGRRTGLIRAAIRFLWQWPYFYSTRVAPTAEFAPIFSGWNYEARRDGAFVPLRSQRESPRTDTPLGGFYLAGDWIDTVSLWLTSKSAEATELTAGFSEALAGLRVRRSGRRDFGREAT